MLTKKWEAAPNDFKPSKILFSNLNNDFPKIFIKNMNKNAFHFKIKFVKYEQTTTYLATNMIMDKNADVGLIVDSPLSI